MTPHGLLVQTVLVPREPRWKLGHCPRPSRLNSKWCVTDRGPNQNRTHRAKRHSPPTGSGNAIKCHSPAEISANLSCSKIHRPCTPARWCAFQGFGVGRINTRGVDTNQLHATIGNRIHERRANWAILRVEAVGVGMGLGYTNNLGGDHPRAGRKRGRAPLRGHQ